MRNCCSVNSTCIFSTINHYPGLDACVHKLLRVGGFTTLYLCEWLQKTIFRFLFIGPNRWTALYRKSTLEVHHSGVHDTFMWKKTIAKTGAWINYKKSAVFELTCFCLVLTNLWGFWMFCVCLLLFCGVFCFCFLAWSNVCCDSETI